MKNLLQWIKSNPIPIVAAVFAVGALIYLMMVRSDGKAFEELLTTRAGEIGKIERHLRVPIDLPAEKPDAPPRKETTVITPKLITDMKLINDKLSDEFEKIFASAVAINKGRHVPMLEGVFPDPGSDDYLLHEARRWYLQAYDEMFREYSPNAAYPRMNAKAAPPREFIEAEIKSAEDNHMATNLVFKTQADLKPEEREELAGVRRAAKIAAVQKWAKRIHVYAQPQRGSGDYPFMVGGWAADGPKPKLVDVWEGQMSLWIQQDIADMVGRANRVSDPDSNVMTAPIKQLLKVEVVPGYVGIDTPGALAQGSGGSGVASGEKKLAEDFSLAPTGRRSNTMYLVRHVKLKMIVDVQKLPQVFDAMGQSNFMSVLSMAMSDVDEYSMLTNYNLAFGPEDCWQVDMVLETIWLCDWVKDLMPGNLRTYLGIPEVPVPATPGEKA